jgi:ABC-type glutathione transport system ATPase component
MEWSNDHRGECIFWLSGMAGTGKSTIARTIARKLDDKGRLGASFFFSKGHGDLGRAAKLFTTIAFQLANALPALRNTLCETIAKRNLIARQALRDQWKHLIYQPLSMLENNQGRGTFLSFTLVIDA